MYHKLTDGCGKINSNKDVKYCYEEDMDDPGVGAGWGNSVSSLPLTQGGQSNLHRAALMQSSYTRQLRGPKSVQQGKVIVFYQLQENIDICTTKLGCTEVVTHKIFVGPHGLSSRNSSGSREDKGFGRLPGAD